MWLLGDDHPGPRAADLVGPLRAALTDVTRMKIFQIKEEAQQREHPVPGIWVYQAVLDHQIGTYDDFTSWLAGESATGLTHWRP